MTWFVRAEHLVPAGAVAVVLAVVAGPVGSGLGSVAVPGGPDVAGSTTARWVALGLLAAPAVMVYLHRWAAAWAAAACAVDWVVLSPGYGWRDFLPCAYAVLAVLVARHGDPAPAPVTLTGALARPPAPPRWPALGTASMWAGIGLLAAALVMVRTTALLAPAVVAAGVGVALLARVRERRRALRLLFAQDQPARAARVVDQLGYLHVLVPAADGRSAVEFGVNTADTWSTADGETREAVVYGEPYPGEWCAVEVDGVVHVPVEPIGVTTLVPYDADHGLPREISDDEEQLVDPDELWPRDHLAAPGAVREHRIAPLRAWSTVSAVGLGAALATAEVLHLAGQAGTWPAVAAVALLSAVAFELAWRAQVRQRLFWNVGGVTVIGFRGAVTEPWTVDTAAVHDDEGAVTLAVGDSVVTIPAPPPWPRNTPQRTKEQLVAGLRDARWQSFACEGALPPPPPADIPRRPLLLAAAWAVTVAVATALFAS